jgi:hypothetical protein
MSKTAKNYVGLFSVNSQRERDTMAISKKRVIIYVEDSKEHNKVQKKSRSKQRAFLRYSSIIVVTVAVFGAGWMVGNGKVRLGNIIQLQVIVVCLIN